MTIRAGFAGDGFRLGEDTPEVWIRHFAAAEPMGPAKVKSAY
ncbi:MAG: hypothetical protein ACREQV_21835 [Candidatus Binatia bacterium]